MLRIFILVILFLPFHQYHMVKYLIKRNVKKFKKYDVSYQSWNNILNRYLKERENLNDKDKKKLIECRRSWKCNESSRSKNEYICQLI